MEIRAYILNYFLTRPNLQNFVVQSLVTLLVKITKYGWFDAYQKVTVFKTIVEDVQTFLQGSVEHCVIGVQILSNLTQVDITITNLIQIKVTHDQLLLIPSLPGNEHDSGR